jgi:hypothetical protein
MAAARWSFFISIWNSHPKMKYAMPHPVPARAAITRAIRSFFMRKEGNDCLGDDYLWYF